MKHIISALVQNEPGVLAHVAGMFAARAFNIDSLAVGRTDDPTISRMTIVVVGDDQVLEQITKQLRRLVNVLRVQDFVDRGFVSRDLVLVKVSCPPAKRSELCTVADVFRANVVHVGEKEMVIELTGNEKKVAAFLGVVGPYGIKEIGDITSVVLLHSH